MDCCDQRNLAVTTTCKKRKEDCEVHLGTKMLQRRLKVAKLLDVANSAISVGIKHIQGRPIIMFSQ